MKWHTGIALRAALVGFLVTFIGFLASTLYHIYKSMDGERGKGLFEIIVSTLHEPMMIYFLVGGVLFGFCLHIAHRPYPLSLLSLDNYCGSCITREGCKLVGGNPLFQQTN